ncbi:hypothetical protein FRX31_013287 [Thalictrum thalictroides]|uniref:Response regulatory domain-containing protein n=1 Tax=Thalictrum thalictroides TaxID=46969 RepID=A0A7J6WI75_THATH|nr:hypothetical protein FRX31_013287 [Thalictrum thalictroides]
MDGFQLLDFVRAVYNMFFLLMPSDHKLDVMERRLEAGACFFFRKPLTMMNYENMWQFIYIENVEYFQQINKEDQGSPPPPQDRSSSLSYVVIFLADNKGIHHILPTLAMEKMKTRR